MAVNNRYRFFILTGEPGVGKTTLTKKITLWLAENGIKSSGFYTEEVRNHRVREGFDIVSLDGTRGRLARDQGLLSSTVKCTVGKYGVLVNEFENIALPSLGKGDSTQPHILVIDEIGKMEFFSEQFKSRIREIFAQNSKYLVLATIPVRKSDRLIESIRNHGEAKVWLVTRENRNNIQELVTGEMKNALKIS